MNDIKPSTARLLNRNGTFNIARAHVKRALGTDLYHTLLSMSWRRFFSLFVATYLLLNLCFGLAYYACGPSAFEGSQAHSEIDRFLESFFFSIQTYATIGYGKVSPLGIIPNLLVTLEALISLIGVAISTGLFFARFARPTAKVVFSNVATVSKHDGELSFLFRMANERLNQIVDATVDLSLVITEFTTEGDRYRNFYDLKLERGRSPLFAISWTIVHPIDKDSPFTKFTKEQLKEQDAEIMVTLTGIDETLAQNIHSRFSYTVDEIVWGGYFVDILNRTEKGVEVDISKLHDLRI